MEVKKTLKIIKLLFQEIIKLLFQVAPLIIWNKLIQIQITLKIINLSSSYLIHLKNFFNNLKYIKFIKNEHSIQINDAIEVINDEKKEE